MMNKRSQEYNKKVAQEAYLKGKPGLLEKAGIIPDRRDNNLYYIQTRNGKKVRVRKGRKRINRRAAKKLIMGAELLGGTAGLAAGAKAGSYIVKKIGRNGVIRQSAMAGGGLVGAGIAIAMVDKALRRYE